MKGQLKKVRNNWFGYSVYVFLQFTWGLLMNIIGCVIYLYYRFKKVPRMTSKGHPIMFVGKDWGAVTLGWFVFSSTNSLHDVVGVQAHEDGHTLQNIILGPLFPLVVGIPSLVHAWFFKHDWTRNKDYYSFYTEKWASKLGESTLL